MLHRKGIENLLGSIKIPTLVMSVRDDAPAGVPTRLAEPARPSRIAASRRSPALATSSPLLIDRDRIARLLNEFWAAAAQKN